MNDPVAARAVFKTTKTDKFESILVVEIGSFFVCSNWLGLFQPFHAKRKFQKYVNESAEDFLVRILWNGNSEVMQSWL